MGRIQPLDKSVVNRIAAGEIIIAPANALKEMMENSIDAGSTAIDVLVKDGGVKLLQITDNGSGIDKEDLPILCQRFTTSKLREFEDLNKLETYGFRGEALASISHIAHVSVITKTKESACAWKSFYSDGEIIPSKPNDSKDPKPVAGKQGTQITAEDFFYNVPSRVKALRSNSEEFSKILDVIGRYAIHTDGVGFSCKKIGDSHYALTTRANLSVKERIRTVYDSSIANELIPIEIPAMEKYGLMGVTGQITNPNYKNKKSVQPIFFINNRLVSNDTLKRALFSAIHHFLPKGQKPFIYLSLKINPNNLDVNVHPTKREVRFLHEDEIIDAICVAITGEFNKIDSSRSFPTQSVLPVVNKHQIDDQSPLPSSHTTQKKARLDYNLVRTDASQTKLTSYGQLQTHKSMTASIPETQEVEEDESIQESSAIGSIDEISYSYDPKERINVNLQSILDLREEVENDTNSRLTEMFSKMIYVGIADVKRRLIAVQFEVKLLLVDFASILNNFFYQVGLREFSNFGTININGAEDEVNIENILQELYDNKDFKPEKSIQEILELFISTREMLLEYFNINFQISNGKLILKSLPLLIKNYTPPLSKLPLFFYRLGTKVDWNDEKECLKGILEQIALLYIPEALEYSGSLADNDPQKELLLEKHQKLNQIMENVLIPNVKQKFLVPKSLEKDIVEIANLPGLYRVFERC